MSFKRQVQRNTLKKNLNEGRAILESTVLSNVEKEAYTKGLREGVERATRYTISVVERALKGTKGIGDKLYESVTDKITSYFNADDFSRTNATSEASKELFHLTVLTSKQSSEYRQLQELWTKYNTVHETSLTLSEFLSIIETSLLSTEDSDRKEVDA